MKKIMTGVAVTATIAVGGWLVYDNVDQRNNLEAANARVATVTDQRNEAQAEAVDAQAEADDLTKQVTDLEATAEKCAVLPKVADHLLNAAGKMGKAQTAGVFLSSYYIGEATRQIEQANTLLDDAQSYDGELWEVCGQTGGTGV